jgi:Glycosyl Hydrolase Family 88.
MKNEYLWIQQELEFVIKKVKSNLDIFKEKVPWACSKNQSYAAVENDYWTSSFWVGMLFLSKEVMQNEEFDEVIECQMRSFQNRLDKKIGLETHDIGFLYALSAMADYKVNQRESSREMAIHAADVLMERYSEEAGIIQAWGNLEDLNESGRMIIDCLMNLPLLYFASVMTGNSKYKEAAYRHAKQTQKYIVRANATTFHTYFFDRKTGEALKGETAQGYANDSCWARGQAWGIYGFTLSYLHTNDESFMESAIKLADYFLSRLPKDDVCYWDLVFVDGDEQERDSSAAVIACCGLLELAKNLPLTDDRKSYYESCVLKIMKALAKGYTTKETPYSNGVLLHGVYDKNNGKGVDECTIWGDYYYLEALVRLTKIWKSYW